MDRNILFLVNPISGTGDRNKLVAHIENQCKERKTLFEIIPTAKDGNYSFLPEKLNTGNFTDLVICGGDGSIAPVVSSIMETNISVGIIPMGSGNGLARTAGISCHLNGALDNVFDGKAERVDAFLINGILSCHLFGIGFDALIAKEFSGSEKRGGITYTKLVAKHLRSLKPYHFEIDIDGKKLTTSSIMINVANANQFGNKFKIAPFASITDGFLDLVLVNAKTLGKIMLPLLRFLVLPTAKVLVKGDQIKNGVNYFKLKELKIKNPDMAPVHIDGDPVAPEQEYSIKIIPAAYQLIVPKTEK